MLVMVLASISTSAQNESKNSRKHYREAEKLRQQKIMEKVAKMLADTMFIYHATDMMVRGSGNMNIGYECDVQVRKIMVISYLPYIGRAYYKSFDIENSGLDFTLEMENYFYRKTKSGYKVGFKISNGSDLMNFTFFISATGYCTLTVGSTRRQSISYYGTIDTITDANTQK
ncbi:MAG: hypothetical protein CR996_01960 [Draconibacterium sp.]|nr:MAG: hypothetical protein CR996_01960 [Draconibacterium sp.]PIF05079.1 MAG: hypothetical protein CSA36_08570 [Draconibacterium sp.]